MENCSGRGLTGGRRQLSKVSLLKKFCMYLLLFLAFLSPGILIKMSRVMLLLNGLWSVFADK